MFADFSDAYLSKYCSCPFPVMLGEAFQSCFTTNYHTIITERLYGRSWNNMYRWNLKYSIIK